MRCEKIATALSEAVQTQDALDAGLASLRAQHLKLRGAFYATRNKVEEPDPSDKLAGSSALVWDCRFPYCENWGQGRDLGPASKQAACECGYCNAMREQRAAAKAQLLPKDQAGRIAEMKRGLAQR